MALVIGADVTKGDWVAVVLDNGRIVDSAVAPSLRELAGIFPSVVCWGVDIPIGLPSGGDGDWPRAADLKARKHVGRRWQSVFLTPPEPVLNENTYDDANALHRRLTGMGLTRPVMPKGVEHRMIRLLPPSSDVVLHPVMPKGVEHISARPMASALASVLHPVMPNGVEHKPKDDLSVAVFSGASP